MAYKQDIGFLFLFYFFCNEIGMVINERKTKVMVINGALLDKTSLTVGDMTIDYTDHYVYLGGHFTDDGKMSSVIERHAAACLKHVNKFASFISRNPSMPYSFKRKVLDAALTSSMLYSSETWLCHNLKSMRTHYMRAIKLLLGVRGSTTNVLCLLEGGFPELESLVLKRRVNFITKFMRTSSGDEPLHDVLNMCIGHNTRAYRVLQVARHFNGDPVILNRQTLMEKCVARRGSSSKTDTYLSLNGELSVHDVYKRSMYIPDYQRVALTRFRLSSHRLRIETGRWIRVPRDQRLCMCDLGVQDEYHVIFICPLTLHARHNFGMHTISDWTTLFKTDSSVLCEFIHTLLGLFA